MPDHDWTIMQAINFLVFGRYDDPTSGLQTAVERAAERGVPAEGYEVGKDPLAVDLQEKFERARKELYSALRAGRVRALGRPVGPFYPREPQRDYVEISMSEWASLKLHVDTFFGKCEDASAWRTNGAKPDYKPQYTDLKIESGGVFGLRTGGAADSRAGAGRPSRMPVLFEEALRLNKAGPPFKNKTDKARHLLEWHEKTWPLHPHKPKNHNSVIRGLNKLSTKTGKDWYLEQNSSGLGGRSGTEAKNK